MTNNRNNRDTVALPIGWGDESQKLAKARRCRLWTASLPSDLQAQIHLADERFYLARNMMEFWCSDRKSWSTHLCSFLGFSLPWQRPLAEACDSSQAWIVLLRPAWSYRWFSCFASQSAEALLYCREEIRPLHPPTSTTDDPHDLLSNCYSPWLPAIHEAEVPHKKSKLSKMRDPYSGNLMCFAHKQAFPICLSVLIL